MISSSVEKEASTRRPHRKTLSGMVVSDSMNKSRVVKVDRYSKHVKYHKYMTLNTRFMAHDEKNESKVGDRVEIMECRPLSKRKSWRITKVLGK